MTELDLPVPEFTLKEEDQEIIITIVAPLSKPKEAAFVLEKDVFTFDSKPYLLKIKLPHPVSDRCKDLVYDSSTLTYKVRLEKVSAKFEIDLDDTSEDVLQGLINSSSQHHDHHDQHEPSEQTEENTSFYGFANRFSRMFGKLYNEFSEVVNLPNPDETDVKDRRKLRIIEEDKKWSDDHYLADMMETEHLESIFMYKPPWAGAKIEVNLTDDEKEIFDKISKRAIRINELSEKEKEVAEYQIVDVLFGYAYNKRTTEGDNTVESGWTINKLCSTLSWFEEFENVKATLLSCYRRSLIYPLYRNWNLTQMIHNDVVDILKLGPNGVVRSLIEVIEIFNGSEDRYLLNTLYVNNLCNYSFHMTRERLQELAQEVKEVTITKYDVNRDLPLLEIAAHVTLEEETGKRESEISNIVDQITELNLGTGNESSSDSDESDSDQSNSTQSSDKEN